MSESGDAIISIRPKYAEAILRGSKTVELRRRIPKIENGTRLWIYATLPLGAVIGTAIVHEVIRGTPEEIWNLFHTEADVDKDSFDAYYSGAQVALGLMLRNAARCRATSIDQLRKVRCGFHPPQVLARLSNKETLKLSKLAEPLVVPNTAGTSNIGFGNFGATCTA